MISNGDLTKVVKFTLLFYSEKSNSDIIEWYKTIKSDSSFFVYWKLFVFFEQWLLEILIMISQAFPKYVFPRDNFIYIWILLPQNIPFLSLKKFVKASNMPLNFNEKSKNVQFYGYILN